MDLKMIMRYRREKAVWQCWNCETENDLHNEECFFCRAKKEDAKVLKPWVEEHMQRQIPKTVVRTEPKPVVSPDRPVLRRVSADSVAPREPIVPEPPASKDSGMLIPVLLWILLLLIIGAVMVAVAL